MQYKKGDNTIIIYTDGSSLGNPGPGGYGVVIVSLPYGEVFELGGGKSHTTNNEMELSAAIAALSYVSSMETPVEIFTDSKYVIQGVTIWVNGWERNGWVTTSKNPVSHKELWQQLVSLTRSYESKTLLSWHYVAGHTGVPGNERADDIAQGFAGSGSFDLYRGMLDGYPYGDILTVNLEQQSANKAARKKSSGKAYSYLSLIDGVVQRHQTWAETEDRVKGKSAKYKKALSAEHEQEILNEWGVSLDN